MMYDSVSVSESPSVFLLAGLWLVLMFMKRSVESVAGARVKKLTATGTFHSRGGERSCQWQRGGGGGGGRGQK